MKTVAVIGAGAAGLAATKCCLDEELLPTCFERTDDIGGLWNYTEDVREGQGCVMKTTYTNTSKEMTAYSDFPMPEEFPMYLHNSLLLKYFRLYADKFNLLKYMKFNSEVLKVSPTENFNETGQWYVTIRQSSSGQPVTVEKKVFDHVMICSGHHVDKYIPDFPGLSNFAGEVIHTRDLRDVRKFEGRRVIVVGLGNSATDAAVELSRVASQVYVSTRSGRWIVNRIHPSGNPIDMSIFRRYLKIIPWKLRVAISRKILNQNLNHRAFSFAPDHDALTLPPTLNDELPVKVVTGEIIIKSDIRKLDNRSVEFSDGSLVEDVDVLICGTGYSFGFPFMDKTVTGMEDNRINLYKLVFPPDLIHSTLAVVGFVLVGGPIINISEMQSRLAVGVFKKQVLLPAREERWKEIHHRRKVNQSRHKDSKGHFIHVNPMDYMDDMAVMIGCKPNIGYLFLTDPRLALQCLFGPLTAFQFRIQGPGKWSGAREAIMSQWERTFYSQRSRTLKHKQEKKSWCGISFGSVIIVVFLAMAVVHFSGYFKKGPFF